jgi:hypothetical protein
MKVTDKRRFTEDGEAREGEEGRESREERKEEENMHHRGTESTEEDTEKRIGREDGIVDTGAGSGAEKMPRGPIDFATFIESLATVALMHMGLVEVRGEEKLPVNMEFAKEQIDILGILEEKTRGNLTPDEGQLLAAILRDLRLGYVRMREQPPRKP